MGHDSREAAPTNSGGLLSGVVSTATSTVNGVTSNGTVGGVLSGTTNTLGGLLGR